MMSQMVCRTCEAKNPVGSRFCNSCGAELTFACPDCGTPRDPAHKFCNECGAAFAADLGAAPTASTPPVAPVPGTARPTAELRHVSVLFVDLVGFTVLSESRDAEDVRELLGVYFERAKTIVARYGGTIEKFIGDAVMAVWGVPVAREDDAERAVRAGLDLVEAVAVFGEQNGAPGLHARAGIVTGQVASLANPGEGLVVGDRVNTAARIQSAADPGTVFVGEVTRQVTSASIAYENAGEHVVKGKSEPLRLYRALRTIAGVAGSERSSGMEAPFAGRDAELRLVKDLLHACMDRGGARIVGVSGQAGAGKTRLAWELSKYTDGLADGLLWHSGRSLSYGEGIAYWALAEMVRQRLGIAEESSTADAAAKLTAGLERWVPDPDERFRIAPALGSLIGTDEPGLAREELFASWRLFFERLSEHHPVVLIFEDMQWADDGLLDFVEQLLGWSADRSIFVCTFARPELSERRDGWPANVRGGTAIQLGPLSDSAIAELLRGLVPELPDPALARIVSQAEGIPLYAVETIRNLVGRGVLAERDGHLEPVGEIGELDVPASLNSLLSARLDSLTSDEREVVKAMAVFSGGFPRTSVSAMTDIADERIDDVLATLVRRDIFMIRTDPLSPERGQYGFAQGLLRTVAYEMISKRERRHLHLAAAEHLRETFADDGEEYAEVIAAHRLDAYHAGSGDPDSGLLRADALTALRRAAQRAGTIGAPDAAERILRSAIELLTDEDERAGLLEEAGQMAQSAGRNSEAIELFERAISIHAAGGRERDAARLVGPLGRSLGLLGRDDEAATRVRFALDSFDETEIDPAVAMLNYEMGVALLDSDASASATFIARALGAAEALEIPELTVRALNIRGLAATDAGRYEEARALFEGGQAMAERLRLQERSLLAINVADIRLKRDMPDTVAACEAAVAVSRQLGLRGHECVNLGNLMAALLWRGRWDEVEAIGREALAGAATDHYGLLWIHHVLGLLEARRGAVEAARSHLASISPWEVSDDHETHHMYLGVAGVTAMAEGRPKDAVDLLETSAREAVGRQGGSGDGARISWGDAVDAALALGEFARAERLVALLAGQPRGRVAPLLRAELSRAQGQLAAARDEHDEAEASFRAAVAAFTELGYSFWRARAQADLAAWLGERGRREDAAPVLEEAKTTLEGLGAKPLLRRVRDLSTARATMPR
jgi:class 3 adenylate cyclase/tetratricopeptide (TPR) repeat protein